MINPTLYHQQSMFYFLFVLIDKRKLVQLLNDQVKITESKPTLDVYHENCI
jgi:hypothetical protein